MRIGIISDIHGNLEALHAVLAALNQPSDGFGPMDAVWCLGDLVGYGPQPNECVDMARSAGWPCVAGNHDTSSAGQTSLEDFNPVAAEALIWTRSHLKADNLTYLSRLPVRLVIEDVTLVHGSPRDPVWEYVQSTQTAGACFSHFATTLCLVGHTHVPAAFRQAGSRAAADRVTPDLPRDLGSARYIINPGSVGQPRDGDPRAAFAVLDTSRGTLVQHRVPYPIVATQARMLQAGLPPRLAERLQFGW